jgi:hypothetical protein
MNDETLSEDGAIVHMTVEGTPSFEPIRKLESWKTPEGGVTGVRYTEAQEIMERDDHVAFVKATMERDA